MREARITARLHHPYAVPVFDVVEHEGQPCLIMQFIPSITLAAVLAEGGPLQPAEAAQVGAQIASALAAAHAVGIAHRDVKPGNILIAEDGEALISDFGIARALGDATLTTTGMVHGTPAYLAPEVARGGESNFASDVFSLGATLYSAMEGTPPFGTDQNSIALLHRVAAGEFPPPQRSGPLTPIVLQMLSLDPDARPTMPVVAHTLEELASDRDRSAIRPAVTAPLPEAVEPADAAPGSSTSAVPSEEKVTGPEEALPGPGRRRRRRIAAAAMAMVALVGAAILVAAMLPGRNPVADPPAGTGSSGSATATSVAASPTPSATRATPTRTPAPSLSGSPRSSARPPSLVPKSRSRTTAPTVNGTPTAAELRRAITSYYALMPRNTDAAWPRMTANYQANHAGGRQGYQRFWDAINRVSVSNVSGSPPNSAQATLTYYYNDGRVVRERTSYVLINDGGRLKISASTVLSSTAL
jgi:serine/threonine protein kinase